MSRARTGLAATLAILGGLAVAGSYGGEYLPDVVAEALGTNGLRVGLGAVSLALLLLAFSRGRVREVVAGGEADRERSVELERRAGELEALARAFRSLSGPIQEQQMLDAVAHAGCELAAGDAAVLMLVDPDRPVLKSRALYNRAQPPPDVPIGNGPIGTVAETGESVLINGSAAIPLVAAGEVLGVLRIDSARDPGIGQAELRVLELFADQAALSILGARAYTRERVNMERLGELDRLKSDFVAMVTHELKTPLTSLLGYATILRRRGDELPAEQRDEFHAIIARQGERILRLIDELLQSSRIEAAERLSREPVDLARMVRDIASEMATARGRTIDVEAPDDDLGLYGDPASLEHVVTNLLDNALKFSPDDTEVRVRIERLPAEVRLIVTDYGQGIEPEELPHVFERFRQAVGTERLRGSVGLGLFISRNLVEAHGGRISVESEPGRGATFTVALPRRREDDGEPPPLEGAEEPGGMLDEVADRTEESAGLGPVDDSVIEGQR